MHRSDKLGLGIIVGGVSLIGGAYLLFRLFGNSYLMAFFAVAGWFVLIAFIAKFFGSWNKDDQS
jgi:hypothetical protein